ncbi:MAG: hypothetical protein JWO86_8387 [Myxococcaceae bacterium]|jgi:hypothetical protein|nr:hypothetical protein [Myxococcaceae bacterium]
MSESGLTRSVLVVVALGSTLGLVGCAEAPDAAPTKPPSARMRCRHADSGRRVVVEMPRLR